MSQNQSYFWQTTRHNVYLKRTAKWHMLLALMAVLTFSTICVAEIDKPEFNDEGTLGARTKLSGDEKNFVKEAEQYDGGNELPLSDATKDTKPKDGFVDAFTASISVILFTELGDKTFFIAAIMAMRHPRLIVFLGAITALALMTVLSVVFGMAATIIPKVYTYYISTALFAIFGLKMIYDGYMMKPTDAMEEMEEVQSDLRKREDELMRKTRGSSKYEDTENKRKNSNSDKEDIESVGGVERSAGASVATATTKVVKNPEMQHRQRKQLNYNNNNNNGCDLNDDNESTGDCTDNDVFLDGGDSHKMATFHQSSPALSSGASSNQTNQTNCDEFNNSPNKLNFKATNGDTPLKNGNLHSAAMVHSASASATMLNNNKKGIAAAASNSINSINSLTSLNSAATAAGQQPNGELKQVGGSKKRLERDVSAALVQDPESGVVRKNTKKSATYLTTRVLMQAFTMTFLAEWGDRSQLTTIILAASKDVYGVIAGGVIGHSICTGLAVVGGRIVAAKISVRTVTIVGGVVFLGFALYALLVRPDDI